MKNIRPIVVMLTLVIILISCSGSDAYQGNWKATDVNGNHFEINFEPKKFTVVDIHDKKAEFDYTQNSVSIKNGIKTYGIKLKDGRSYNITFPIKKEAGKAAITLENHQTIYTISRTDYIDYQDLYELNN